MPSSTALALAPELLFVGHHLIRGEPPPAHSFVATSHAFTLLLRGEAEVRMDEARIPATRPLLWLVPAGTRSEQRIRSGLESWYAGFRWTGLGLRARGVADLVIDAGGFSVEQPRWKVLDGSTAARLVEIYRELESCSGRHGLSTAARTSGLLLEIFSCFLDLPSAVQETLGHRALLKFKRMLEDDACDHLGIETLALQCGASADHLRTIFQRRFGVRPGEFRNRIRLNRARNQLMTGSTNVTQAARLSGFADPLYFSRVFRKRFGISPRELIRNHRLQG